MSRIFWDTNLFIYLIEENDEWCERVTALHQRMSARGDQLLTSALTLGEILVRPTQAARADLCAKYEAALRSLAIILPFDERAASFYAAIRQDRTIRPPDAIQLACAALGKTDLFITNDQRLSRKSIQGVHFLTSLEQAPI